MSVTKTNNKWLNPVLIIIVLVLLMIFFSRVDVRWDLTEEHRFTLSPNTIDLIQSIDNPVHVQLLLDGELPAGFERLSAETEDMLRRYKRQSKGMFTYEIMNPAEGSVKQQNETKKLLAEEGIVPVNVRVMEADEFKEKLVYPFVLMRSGERAYYINLLENEIIGMTPDEILNNSVSLLEYKLSNGLYKLRTVKDKNVLFLEGHGELSSKHRASMEYELNKFYNLGRIVLDSVYKIDKRIDLLIVARPQSSFSQRDKFLLDQYVMQGGKIFWMLDRLNVGMDSLRTNRIYVPFPYNLNLDDLFFKYGFRLNTDLVQDLECSQIPLSVGQVAGKSQLEMKRFYYDPLCIPLMGHPITNSLDRINMNFANTIDTLQTKYPVQKTTLLTASNYARFIMAPMQLDLEIFRYPPEVDKFNRKGLITALLLEGKFASLFENRVSESMQQGLAQLGESFKPASVDNKMLIVADGDMAKSYWKQGSQEVYPMGYNRFEKRQYGNHEFFMNAVEYLINGGEILSTRTKEVKLRMLNMVKAKEEKSMWQFINIGLPIILLLLIGFAYNAIKKRNYSRL